MLKRGGFFGFISLFFINPLIIILFQNFTSTKDTTPAKLTQTSLSKSARSPASVLLPDHKNLSEHKSEILSKFPKRYESSLE